MGKAVQSTALLQSEKTKQRSSIAVLRPQGTGRNARVHTRPDSPTPPQNDSTKCWQCLPEDPRWLTALRIFYPLKNVFPCSFHFRYKKATNRSNASEHLLYVSKRLSLNAFENSLSLCLSLLLLLLSLDAHNHVDDYSGTLGSVRKVHISALVTSP